MPKGPSLGYDHVCCLVVAVPCCSSKLSTSLGTGPVGKRVFVECLLSIDPGSNYPRHSHTQNHRSISLVERRWLVWQLLHANECLNSVDLWKSLQVLQYKMGKHSPKPWVLPLMLIGVACLYRNLRSRFYSLRSLPQLNGVYRRAFNCGLRIRRYLFRWVYGNVPHHTPS